jgi:ornithine carbamoyltransferase
MSPRHFLEVSDLSGDELRALIRRARELKLLYAVDRSYLPLSGRSLAMVFEKSSTRTRVSFEAGMSQLGGNAIFLSAGDSQLGRGEPMEDTARVLSRMVDAIMVRTGCHEGLKRFAAHSMVPVINGLSDVAHPCQFLADWLTFEEYRGSLARRTVAWVGDGNNMCQTYLTAAAHLGFELRIASPAGFEPRLLEGRLPHEVTLVRDPRDAVRGADLVLTDVWISMGQEPEREARMKAFADYRVDASLLDLASPDVLFMHCLPAHRGEEVDDTVLDDPRSVVWEEAGNRLHAQKALLEFLVNPEAFARPLGEAYVAMADKRA